MAAQISQYHIPASEDQAVGERCSPNCTSAVKSETSIPTLEPPVRHPELYLAATLIACLALGECQFANADQQPPEAAAAAHQAATEEFEAWLAGLDSPLYAERERSTDALLAAGASAVPYLKRAAHGDSLEAADRAVWVLQQLAERGEQPLQLAVLEVLVATKRFPAVASQADAALAELQAHLCRDRLESLGAEFVSTADRTTFTGDINDLQMNIKVNTNRDQWTGNGEDLLLLTKLRQVSKLTIASQMLDNEIVAKIAAIEGLTSLTLIETSVDVEMMRQLNEKFPDLRVIFHSRAKLGVQFIEGQPLTITVVQPGTPADRAGMRAGDRVTKFAGEEVETFDRLTALIAQYPPGKSVDITVERAGEEVVLTAELGGTDWWEELKNR